MTSGPNNVIPPPANKQSLEQQMYGGQRLMANSADPRMRSSPLNSHIVDKAVIS